MVGVRSDPVDNGSICYRTEEVHRCKFVSSSPK